MVEPFVRSLLYTAGPAPGPPNRVPSRLGTQVLRTGYPADSAPKSSGRAHGGLGARGPPDRRRARHPAGARRGRLGQGNPAADPWRAVVSACGAVAGPEGPGRRARRVLVRRTWAPSRLGIRSGGPECRVGWVPGSEDPAPNRPCTATMARTARR